MGDFDRVLEVEMQRSAKLLREARKTKSIDEVTITNAQPKGLGARDMLRTVELELMRTRIEEEARRAYEKAAGSGAKVTKNSKSKSARRSCSPQRSKMVYVFNVSKSWPFFQFGSSAFKL